MTDVQSNGSDGEGEVTDDWPWQRLFRCVISSCRPVSMARCSCFRKAMPRSTLATCCSSLPASMARSPHNLHTGAGSWMTWMFTQQRRAPTRSGAWILNANSMGKNVHCKSGNRALTFIACIMQQPALSFNPPWSRFWRMQGVWFVALPVRVHWSPWPTVILKRYPIHSVSHGSSYRSGISVLDAAQMEKTKEPCKTSSMQKKGTFLVWFTAVLLLWQFFPPAEWMNLAAVRSRNNLPVTFWLYAHYGAAVVFTTKQPVWGVISATTQEEEELRGNGATSCQQE